MLAIWAAMMVGSIIIAFFTGNLQAVNEAIFTSAASGATFAIGLLGVMALWLGLMKIAEEAKINMILARLLKPITKRLFPSIPPESNAMGSMVLAFAAVTLGLLDAATPIAIKALRDMQEYNDDPEVVTDDQAVFTAVIVANLALVTPTVIAARVAAGSTNATEIVGPTIVVTLMSTILCVFLTKMFAKLPRYRRKAAATTVTTDNSISQ